MRVTTLVERSWINCDGCEYTMGAEMIELRIPWGENVEVFHFHPPFDQGGDPHDCFRYWAHEPRIMERSLKNREQPPAVIAEFMALHLYRPALGRDPEKVVVVQGPPPRDVSTESTESPA